MNNITVGGLPATPAQIAAIRAALGITDLPIGTALSISGTPLTSGTAGAAYGGFVAVASGGTAPYAFSLNAAAAAAGLAVGPTSGVVSGTLTTAATFAAAVMVSDALSAFAVLPFTLVIGGSSVVAPTITTQPSAQNVTAPATATFSVVATTGGGTLAYQWRLNGANIAGATSASYTTPATSTSDSGGVFSVVVSNTAGSLTSSTALLTVGAATAAPTITTQPTARSVTAPATATFTVVASGTAPLTYQWRKGGTAISGATSASYTTPATTTGDSGSSFDCVVTNTYGSITTTAVSLTVAAAAADTRPRFGYAPANSTADQTAFASLFSGMTPLTDSSNAGRTGTFSTVSSSTNYTWIAVLHSAAPSGIRIYDGTGYGGFSGAASTSIYAGADTNPLTVHGTYTNSADGNVYDMYRGNGKASTFPTFTLS